jgi:hypothetical protein
LFNGKELDAGSVRDGGDTTRRARRQYDAVDPDNRLVAGEEERLWHERLAAVARLEEEIQSAHAEQPAALRDDERATPLALADDVPRLWNRPSVSAETRKRILRIILKEIIVTVGPDRLHLMLHWQGGDHARLEVIKNRTGEHRWRTDAATEQLIRELARILLDQSIASVLNRLGIRPAKGRTWTQLRMRNFRCEHQIAIIEMVNGPSGASVLLAGLAVTNGAAFRFATIARLAIGRRGCSVTLGCHCDPGPPAPLQLSHHDLRRQLPAAREEAHRVIESADDRSYPCLV